MCNPGVVLGSRVGGTGVILALVLVFLSGPSLAAFVSPSPAATIVPCPGYGWPKPWSTEPGPVPLAPCPGNEIAYVLRAGTRWQLVLMFPNGSNAGPVYTSNDWFGYLAWAPSSKSIAFWESGHIWRVELSIVEGRFHGSPRMLLQDGEAAGLSWSPPGSTIALARGSSLGEMFATGGDITTLYRGPRDGRVSLPTWNTFGTQIAFVETDMLGRRSIKTMDRDTQRITHTLVAGWFADISGLDWARKGADVLTFAARTCGDPSCWSVYTLDINTGFPKRITAGISPSWAPDNKKIVYKEMKWEGNLYVFDLANGTRAQVARTGEGPSWNRAPVPAPIDTIPPAPVEDLAKDPRGAGALPYSVALTWTATGDDGYAGTAYLYDVRYRGDVPMTDETWDTATPALGEPLPAPAGTREYYTVHRLRPERMYWFALKVVDEAGNWSGLSNVIGVVTPSVPPGGWYIEAVNQPWHGGGWLEMALDRAGVPHLAYYFDWSLDLSATHATRTLTGWSDERVPDSSSDFGRWTSIAVDANGIVYVAYKDDAANSLKLARRSGTNWTIETVDAQGSVGGWNSITLDANGYPHIAYRQGWDNSAGGLKYARWTGTAWVRQVVDGANTAALGGTSIALDSLGRPRIAYKVASSINFNGPGDLKYARWTGTSWTFEMIEGPGANVGPWGLSLKLDATDTAHVGYHTGEDIKYARRAPAGWQSQVIVANTGSEVSLALDASGNPHLSFQAGLNEDVKYASWNGTAWVIETVEAYGQVGWYTSLAFGPDNKPRIAYMDDLNDSVRFARKT